MERTLTLEERIRRAEEIYERRKNNNIGIRVSTNTVNNSNKKDYRLLKKLGIQILACLLIYLSFYLIQNSNYFFSENVLNKTKEILSYDINFEEVYNSVVAFYNENIKKLFKNEKKLEGQVENSNIIENQEIQIQNLNIQNDEEISKITELQEESSTDTITTNETNEKEEEEITLTQMEIDANEIKRNYNLIIPLKGPISSKFGERTPTDIVSANHAGIDIAVDEGTVFVAAMSGIVEYVSYEKGYGNFFCIKQDDISTIYAHCNDIYVKEGEKIEQGEEIGEVGQTGNATGPHLHFEIRKENRTIDPEYILEF